MHEEMILQTELNVTLLASEIENHHMLDKFVLDSDVITGGLI